MFRKIFPNQTILQRHAPAAKFVTKVLALNNQIVDVTIDHHHDGGIQHRVFIRKNGEETSLGDMRYFIWDDHLYICKMHNTSQYRHIGTLLHEYAFRDSIRHGKNGDVRLSAVESSHYFHFQNGFRPIPETKMICSLEMAYGFFRKKDLTREWEEKFAAMPKGSRKDTTTWGRCDMHYPDAIIQQKKEKFGLLSLTLKPTTTTLSEQALRKK